MKNEKLQSFITLRGISHSELSKLTGIPATTLGRIINGKVDKVKRTHMEAIAKALNTSIYSLFDLPLNIPNNTKIRPEEAGATITKTLDPDESLLLYWFQNSYSERKTIILSTAKREYYKTQEHILSESGLNKSKKEIDIDGQISLFSKGTE